MPEVRGALPGAGPAGCHGTSSESSLIGCVKGLRTRSRRLLPSTEFLSEFELQREIL